MAPVIRDKQVVPVPQHSTNAGVKKPAIKSLNKAINSGLKDAAKKQIEKAATTIEDFPQEIKEKIFESALPTDMVIEPHVTQGLGPLSILVANKKWNQEASKILYGQNVFCFRDFLDCMMFLREIAAVNSKYIKAMMLEQIWCTYSPIAVQPFKIQPAPYVARSGKYTKFLAERCPELKYLRIANVKPINDNWPPAKLEKFRDELSVLPFTNISYKPQQPPRVLRNQSVLLLRNIAVNRIEQDPHNYTDLDLSAIITAIENKHERTKQEGIRKAKATKAKNRKLREDGTIPA